MFCSNIYWNGFDVLHVNKYRNINPRKLLNYEKHFSKYLSDYYRIIVIPIQIFLSTFGNKNCVHN